MHVGHYLVLGFFGTQSASQSTSSAAVGAGGALPLYLYRRPLADIPKPRKPRRRRLIDALLVVRAL